MNQEKEGNKRLTEEEIKQVRELLDNNEKAWWLLSIIKSFVRWTSATVVAVWAFYQAVKDSAIWRALWY